jgi:hypothetical protein
VTNLNLRIGHHDVRVACDSRKGSRLLESSLAAHLVNRGESPELAFLLNGPRSLQRSHFLIDRSGFTLSRNRGLEAGLAALASHLTALLPAPVGHFRVRARAIIKDGTAVLCTSPLLLAPRLSERVLVKNDLLLIDRLAVDIGSEGVVSNEPIPWPRLAELEPGPGHARPHGRRPVSAVLLALPGGMATPTKAAVAAHLAEQTIEGDPLQILEGCARLVERADIVGVHLPQDEASLSELIQAVERWV